MIEQPRTMGKKGGGDFPGGPKGPMASQAAPPGSLTCSRMQLQEPRYHPKPQCSHLSSWRGRAHCLLLPWVDEAALGGELGKSITIHHLR